MDKAPAKFIDYDCSDGCNEIVENFINDKKEDKMLVIDNENNIATYTDNNDNAHIINFYNINIMEKYLKRLTPYVVKINYENLADKYDIKTCPLTSLQVFQKAVGLDKQPFNYKVEIVNILEELIETKGSMSKEARAAAMDLFDGLFKDETHVEGDELVDAFADIIVFALGAITKLGYDNRKVLKEVSKVVNSRKGEIIDGKFIKDKSDESKALWYKPNYEKCKK